MSEILNCDKVMAVLLQYGDWYDVEPETLNVVSSTNFWVATLELVHLLGRTTAPGSPVRAMRSFSSDTQYSGVV
jgi:hypothetical protein